MKRQKKQKSLNKKTEKNKILAVIRIHGQVKVNDPIKNTLERLQIKRKYHCILINTNNKSLIGMLEKVKYYVAFGEINKSTLSKLIKERAKGLDKKNINSEKITEEIIKGKSLKELKIIPFLRLHPPRKGINSKLQYPKGVLGNNGENINKLIERML